MSLLKKISPIALAVVVCSCSDLVDEGAQLKTEVSHNAPKAQQLHAKGQAKEQAGKYKDAAEIYDTLATKYPSYGKAPELNFQAAQYWEKVSNPEKAFSSYHNYIRTFRNGRNYKSALDRQSSIAFMAAKGGLTKNFLGLKQEPAYEQVIEFLSKVRDNAPASDLAAKAQFAIGTYSEGKEKQDKAVAAYFKVADDYPNHSLAPEATFRAGKVLSGITESGNQNSSNLNRARRTLEDLIQQYPGSSQATQAKELLSKISGTDIQRTYDIAEFYEAKGKGSSAKFYYQEVVDKAPKGSELYNKAQARVNAL